MTSVVELLRQLVSISSVSRESNRGVIAYTQSVLANAGWSFQEQAYLDPSGVEKINLVAWPAGLPPKDRTVELALVCHTDTVPYAADWTDATALISEGDDLKGCGACDVKGFLACLLAVAGQIEKPKFAIVGEPTSLRPIRAGKGYCLAEVTVIGREAHSAFPEKGESAIYRAARLIVEIEKIAERLKEFRSDDFSPPFTTINIGEIQGGVAKNVVPPSCRFLLEWRPIPGQDPNMVPGLVESVAENLAKADSGFRCDIKLLRTQEGFAVSEECELVGALAGASGNAYGSVAFGTEAPWLKKMGAEAVVFGPGSMLSAHSPREFVPLPELARCVEILKTVIYELCG